MSKEFSVIAKEKIQMIGLEVYDNLTQPEVKPEKMRNYFKEQGPLFVVSLVEEEIEQTNETKAEKITKKLKEWYKTECTAEQYLIGG